LNREACDGGSEAEDVPVQYAASPVAVEGGADYPGDLRPLPFQKAAAHRVPHVRDVRQAPGA